MSNPPHLHPRDPKNVHAWLVGSGIASLTAALHLLHDAKLDGPNIHIIDVHRESGGGMTIHGDTENGYFLPFECNPHFHGECIERLLSLIPSEEEPGSGESILDGIRAREKPELSAPVARFVKIGRGGSGAEVFHPRGIQVGAVHRLALVGFMLEHEGAIGEKSIEDVFDQAFFTTDFWKLWATTFALHPWHSAVEFQRHLRKYLEDIRSLNHVKTLNRTQYSLVESVIEPLTTHLKNQGVDFRFNHRVTDLRAYPEGDPTTISEIELTTSDGATQELVTLDPVDIVIVTLGSTSSGAALGTNTTPPTGLTSNWEDLMEGDWKLWEKLALKSPKFGNPLSFIPRIQQSLAETFTTTFHGPVFTDLYHKLTHDEPGTGTFLSLSESNWGVTISIPHQPIFSTQPPDVTVMLGYALNPTAEGNYIKKDMWQCTGEEILREVLSHLGLAGEIEGIVATAKTIPCGLPMGTSPFLTRARGDRPAVIPECTTNIACVGQFVEIPGDTTLEIEYSVRGAQLAVAELMGLEGKPGKPTKSLLLEIFDLLI